MSRFTSIKLIFCYQPYPSFTFQMIQNHWRRELWLIRTLKISTKNFNIMIECIKLRERRMGRTGRLRSKNRVLRLNKKKCISTRYLAPVTLTWELMTSISKYYVTPIFCLFNVNCIMFILFLVCIVYRMRQEKLCWAMEHHIQMWSPP